MSSGGKKSSIINIGGGGGGDTDPTFTTLTEGQVPKTDAASKLIYGGATVDPITEEWTFDKDINVPSATVNFGDTVATSSGSGELVITNNVTGESGYAVTKKLKTTETTVPQFIDYGVEYSIPLQSDFTQTLTTNPLTWSVTGSVVSPEIRQVNSFQFKTGAAMTNTRMRFVDNATGLTIMHIPDRAAWDSGSGGLDLVSGDNLIDFLSKAADTVGVYNIGIKPFTISDGQDVDLEIIADSVSVLGDVSGDPYQIANVQDGKPLNLINDDGNGNVTVQGDVHIEEDAIVDGNLTVGGLTNNYESPFGGYGHIENYVQYSEDLTNAVWANFPAVGTVTSSSETAPNGKPTADEVTFVSNGLAFRQATLGTTTATDYTVSFWAKLVSGDGSFSLDIGDGVASGVITATSEWQRFKVLLTSSADWLDLAKQGGIGVINFWGWQVVLGDNDYPYVKTTSIDIQTPEYGAVVNDTLYVTSALGMVHTGTQAALTNLTGNFQISTVEGDLILDNANVTGETAVWLGSNNDATAFAVRRFNDDPALYATGLGTVGIGTDSPASCLHILENSGQIGAAAGITMEQTGLGDATLHYLAGGATFSTGIDQSDSNKFKISNGADLSVNNRLTIDTSGLVGVGTNTPVSALHTFENNAFTDALAGINIQQAGAGDSVLHFELPAQAWTIGANNSTADSFAISSGSDLSINNYFGISATTGAVGIPNDLVVATGAFKVDVSATRVSVGTPTALSRFHVYEDSVEVGAAAGVTIENAGTGDAVTHYYLTGTQYWSIGADDSDLDSFKISAGSTLGTNDYMAITPAGNTQFNLGGNDNSATFAIHNANGDPLFHLDGNATVGFGTDSPIADIHVYQNNSNTGLASGIYVEQEGSGDAQIAFGLSVGNSFAMGVDQSDNETFKICASGLLGSNDRFTIDGVSTIINLSTDSAGSDFRVEGLSGGTAIEALGSGDVGINGAALEGQPLTINTVTGDDVELSTLKAVVITDSNFGNANSTDLYFNRGGAGFNQSEFFMYNNNNNVDTGRYFRMNYSNNGDTDQNGLQINYDGSVIIPFLKTLASLPSRVGFAATTTTASLGLADVYACTDTTAARTLTLSAFDFDIGTTENVHRITIKDESGGAGTNNITIDTEGTEAIDGQSSITITADYGDITVYSNGSNWFVIGA